jgi:hypothetical protein
MVSAPVRRPDGTEQLVSITVTADVPCKATDSTYRTDTPAVLAFIDSITSAPLG